MTIEELRVLFRHTMALPLCREEELGLREALQCLMLQLLARRDLTQSPELQGMLLACRLRLRKLQLTLAAAREDAGFAPLCCDLRSLTAELCSACDALLHSLGRRLRFSGPEEPIYAACEPRAISGLVTELICNAARHSPAQDITLALSPKIPARRKRPNACVITVTAAGSMDLARLHRAAAQPGSGAAAMLRTARLHRGALLWLSQNGSAAASLRLPLPPSLHTLPLRSPPGTLELLSDPCSGVYVGLAQVCGTLDVNS